MQANAVATLPFPATAGCIKHSMQVCQAPQLGAQASYTVNRWRRQRQDVPLINQSDRDAATHSHDHALSAGQHAGRLPSNSVQGDRLPEHRGRNRSVPQEQRLQSGWSSAWQYVYALGTAPLIPTCIAARPCLPLLVPRTTCGASTGVQRRRWRAHRGAAHPEQCRGAQRQPGRDQGEAHEARGCICPPDAQ